MKNRKNTEMWKNALAQIDEKYIAEAAEFAPEPKNAVPRAAKEKGGTGNLGFVFAAAAAVIVSFIGVGFFFNGTGIEPLSPSSEGTVGSSSEITETETSDINGNGNMTTTIIMKENGEITTVISKSDVSVVTTTAIDDNGEITTATIGEYAEITTAPLSPERYQEWFDEAEENKEIYSKKIEETENYIADLEKLIADLEKKLETENFKQKSDYDMVKADLEIESIRLAQLKAELELLKADYYEQVLLIEYNRKTFAELYPDTAETKQPLTMEILRALVFTKGKELTWSDFEQFEGEDVGSGLYIMEYPVDEIFVLVVGGVPSEKPMYVNLVAGDKNVFSITDNGAEGFEEFVEKSDYQYSLQYDGTNPTKVISFEYNEENTSIAVTIPEGVTEIGEGVFMNTDIESVALPSTLKIIGKNAFKDCTSLKEISIPYGVTTISEGAFENCISLPATLTLPDTVTIIDGAFRGCTQFDGTIKPITTKSTDIVVNTISVDGEFIFEYFIDGVLQENMTETRNLAETDEFKWTVEGYGVHEYAVQVTSPATKKTGMLYSMEVDFTTNPPTKNQNDTFNSNLFRELLATLADFTLVCPVDKINITFGYEEYEGHKGIDYSGEKGQDISAAAEGTVSLAEWNGQYGNCVIIDHLNGYQSLYAHLDEIKVKAGDAVTAGQTIGTMGHTGMVTGIQLHFELIKDGENLNPEDYMIK